MDLEALKRAKREMKMTIAEIAKKANLPKGTVQNIFAGYVPNQRSDTVEAIERALGLRDSGLKDTARVEVTPQEYRLLLLFRAQDKVTRVRLPFPAPKKTGLNARFFMLFGVSRGIFESLPPQSAPTIFSSKLFPFPSFRSHDERNFFVKKSKFFPKNA